MKRKIDFLKQAEMRLNSGSSDLREHLGKRDFSVISQNVAQALQSAYEQGRSDERERDTVDKAEAWDAVAAARKDEKQKRSPVEAEIIEALKGVLTECAPEDAENWGQDAIDAWSNAEQAIQKAEGK